MKLNDNYTQAETVRNFIESSLLDGKAQDIVSIDLSGKSDMADYMVVASGTSSTHVGSIAGKLMKKMKEAGLECLGAEGYPDCDWVLVDNPYVVVHIFRPEVRSHYGLEKMWEADMPAELEEAY